MIRRSAFTLLELLAASALAAVLMLVLFQVIGSLGRARVALARAEAAGAQHGAWKTDLLDLLRWDLTNATSVQLEPDRVTLSGNGSLDRRTLAADHDPVTVVYAVERRGGRPCLVRRQMPRGTGGRPWSELLCADVSRFTLERSTSRRGDGFGVQQHNPRALRVQVQSGEGAAIDEIIVVR